MRRLTLLLCLCVGACADSLSTPVPDAGLDMSDNPMDDAGDATVRDVARDLARDSAEADMLVDADARPDDARMDATDTPDTPDTADTPDTPDAPDAPDVPDATPEDTVCPEVDVPEVRFAGTGRYRQLADFSAEGILPRGLTVYLPEGYDRGDQRYPVVYMHDGQNLFDARRAAFGVEWGVDETLDALVAGGAVRPWIVVGIDNTSARIDDYTPTRDGGRGAGGNADAYLDAVVDGVKPLVDAHFRTLCGRSNTAIMGSSLGGLVSLHAANVHGETFGRFGVVSPSLWWDGRSQIRAFAAAQRPRPVRLWLDAGSEESERGDTLTNDLTNNVRAVAGLARDAGMRDGRDLAVLEDQGAAHNEASWARRLPAILLFLLGDDDYNELEPTGLNLWAWDAVVPVDGRAALTVEAVFASGGRIALPPSAVRFTTDNPGVAAVEDGEVLGLARGRVRVVGEWRAVQATLVLGVGGGRLTFVVSAPGDTPMGASLFVTGNADALGPWDPAGLALARTDRGWEGTVDVPIDSLLEFKITRGSWETVEKAADGGELPNRRWQVDGDEDVAVTVARWADQ